MEWHIISIKAGFHYWKNIGANLVCAVLAPLVVPLSMEAMPASSTRKAASAASSRKLPAVRSSAAAAQHVATTVCTRPVIHGGLACNVLMNC